MRAARLPADEDHPYGHGRFVTVGALVVGGMLVAAGAGAASHALDAGVHARRSSASPGKIALVAALVSIVAKEGLFRATARVGKRLRSPVLEAATAAGPTRCRPSALVGIAAARCSLKIFRHADAAAGLAVAAMLAATAFRSRRARCRSRRTRSTRTRSSVYGLPCSPCRASRRSLH